MFMQFSLFKFDFILGIVPGFDHRRRILPAFRLRIGTYKNCVELQWFTENDKKCFIWRFFRLGGIRIDGKPVPHPSSI